MGHLQKFQHLVDTLVSGLSLVALKQVTHVLVKGRLTGHFTFVKTVHHILSHKTPKVSISQSQMLYCPTNALKYIKPLNC